MIPSPAVEKAFYLRIEKGFSWHLIREFIKYKGYGDYEVSDIRDAVYAAYPQKIPVLKV